MQSRMQPQMQSQGLTLPVEAEVGPSVAHVDDVSLGNDQVKLGVGGLSIIEIIFRLEHLEAHIGMVWIFFLE